MDEPRCHMTIMLMWRPLFRPHHLLTMFPVLSTHHLLPIPEFVPGPAYPKFMPPEDDVLLPEEQPLSAAISPTADSPGYIPEFDPEEDLEEDDEDPEEDPADYPTDRDDDDKDIKKDPANYPTDKDDDKEEEKSYKDDVDDEEEDEKDDEEEEEHPALADFVPPFVHRVTTRMSVRAQTPISLP
nr:hypothetical protein [Tanacetum cinerariifolium]